MDFTLFDITNAPADSLVYNTDEYEEVEMGLSPGELRQSIIDRTKTDLEQGFHSLNKNLSVFELSVNEEYLHDPNKVQQVIDDLDNLLYDILEDSDLDDTVWRFKDSTIYVKGTE